VRSGTQQTAVVVMSDIRELGTVLSIWAHPDDEAYLCGRIVAMAAAARSRVVCVTATRGELGEPSAWTTHKSTALPAQDTGKHCLLLMSNIAAMVA
jgi:LmbE family N-acetylglucosaminyl deacetylase